MSDRPYQRRRRRQREQALAAATQLAEQLADRVDLIGVAVFGSFARGDFHDASDIDVLVIAEGLPVSTRDRLLLCEPRPHRVEAVPWSPEEYLGRLADNDLIAVEAHAQGVWVWGAPPSGQRPERRPSAGCYRTGAR